MTVWSDLERSIAMAEASRGNYLLFATDSDEEKAKKVFKEMAEDMERHVMILESRRDFLAQNNPLNAYAAEKGSEGDSKQEKKASGKKGSAS